MSITTLYSIDQDRSMYSSSMLCSSHIELRTQDWSPRSRSMSCSMLYYSIESKDQDRSMSS